MWPQPQGPRDCPEPLAPPLLGSSTPPLLGSSTPRLLRSSTPWLLGSSTPWLLHSLAPLLLRSSAPSLLWTFLPCESLELALSLLSFYYINIIHSNFKEQIKAHMTGAQSGVSPCIPNINLRYHFLHQHIDTCLSRPVEIHSGLSQNSITSLFCRSSNSSLRQSKPYSPQPSLNS
jgi:hypothetical protein